MGYQQGYPVQYQPNGLQSGSFAASGELVTLQTAKAMVQSANRQQSATTRLFLDCGSQRSYITEALAQQLQLHPKGTQRLEVFTFGSKEKKVVQTAVVSFRIQ